MTHPAREQMIQRIRANIIQSGRHIYAVMGEESPRYLYTIGLKERVGVEIVLTGQSTLPLQAAHHLVNLISDELQRGTAPKDLSVSLEPYGPFTLGEVHPSWSQRLMLGVLDFYNCKSFRALQVLPPSEQRTIDTADMSKPFSPSEHPVWQWFEAPWPYPVSSSSRVITNHDALKGYAVTELVRWEDDGWEMFCGPAPEIPEEDMVVVPLAILLAFDPTLEAALSLPIGVGLYREFEDDGPGLWQRWESQSE